MLQHWPHGSWATNTNTKAATLLPSTHFICLMKPCIALQSSPRTLRKEKKRQNSYLACSRWWEDQHGNTAVVEIRLWFSGNAFRRGEMIDSWIHLWEWRDGMAGSCEQKRKQSLHGWYWGDCRIVACGAIQYHWKQLPHKNYASRLADNEHTEIN